MTRFRNGVLHFRINRVSCGIDLIMPLSEPAMGCVASA